MIFLLMIASLSLVYGDFVTDCVSECRTNKTTFDGFDGQLNCLCGTNCTEFVSLATCQERCVDAVNTTYVYSIDRDTLCDQSDCSCVCPERTFQNIDGCKRHCLDTNRQYPSFKVTFQQKSNCFFENCTCGEVCPFSPATVEFCPPIRNKRAMYITYGFDRFGCPDNKCHYADCDDHTVEDFCWMTCPPFTYPQGCFVETDECTECVCAKQPRNLTRVTHSRISFQSSSAMRIAKSIVMQLTDEQCVRVLDSSLSANVFLLQTSSVTRYASRKRTDTVTLSM